MRTFVKAAIFFAACSVSASTVVAEEQLYDQAPGDQIMDQGTMVVTREGAIVRRDVFEIIRRSDGGRTIASVITAEDGSYQVEGRWDYDAAEQATSARGLGRHGEQDLTVDIAATSPTATMAVTFASGEERVYEGECPPGCFIDMGPGTLPQFTLTRRYDFDQGGVQDSRWIAFVLNEDMRSFDVVVRIAHAGDFDVTRADGSSLKIRHFVFDEEGSLDGSGEGYELRSHLWVDDDHRPIKYKAGERTVGLRAGFEDIGDQLAPE